MKTLKNWSPIISALLLVTNIGSTQTASVFIDVGHGIATSVVCTPFSLANVQPEDVDGEFSCSSPIGIAGGPYMFLDPVPLGNMITNIEVILYNSGCQSNNSISVEDAMLMISSTNSCTSRTVRCGEQNISTSQPFAPNDMLGYNYGDMNQFEIISDGSGNGGICFTHAELVFTYTTTIPTMSQWALMILGLILTSLAVVRIRRVALA